MDFYPIINEAGLLGENYIRFESFSITDDGKKRVEKIAAEDRRNQTLMSELGAERFRQKPIVEGLHHDSRLAAHLKTPFLTDNRIGRFIALRSQQLVAEWNIDVRPAILDVTMGVVLPDFASLSWDQVTAIRESAAGRDLRRHLVAAAAEVAAAADEVSDLRDLTIIIQRYYLEEPSSEVGACIRQRVMQSST